MEKDRTKKVLNLALEIINLLTGQNYNIVRKPDGISRDVGLNNSASSYIQDLNEDQLKVMIQQVSQLLYLLTEEVPVKFGDVAVYFTRDEWEFMNEHKELYSKHLSDTPLVRGPQGQFNVTSKRVLKLKKEEEQVACQYSNKKARLTDTRAGDAGVHNEMLLKIEIKEEPGGWPEFDECRSQADSGSIDASCFESESEPENFDCSTDSTGTSSGEDLKESVTSCVAEHSDESMPRSKSEHPPSFPLLSDCMLDKNPDMQRPYWLNYSSQELSWRRMTKSITNSPMGSFAKDQELTTAHTMHNAMHTVNNDPKYTVPDIIQKDLSLKRKREYAENINYESTSSIQQITLTSGVQTCPEYQEFFARAPDLVTHQGVVHNGKGNSYICLECGKQLSCRSALVRHKIIHTGEKQFVCSQCGKSFTQSTSLDRHRRVHTGEKLFICSDCGKCFNRRSNLITHQRIHTLEKPFLCGQCGKCFVKRAHLFTHQIIHTGEKPFVCSQCGKRFTQSASLERHHLIHTGEKPFSCMDCGKCFNRKFNLLTHQRTHKTLKLTKSPQPTEYTFPSFTIGHSSGILPSVGSFLPYCAVCCENGTYCTVCRGNCTRITAGLESSAIALRDQESNRLHEDQRSPEPPIGKD